MTTFEATFEGQTPTTAVTVANSDDFGDPALLAVQGTVTYDTAGTHSGSGALTMSQAGAQSNVTYADGADFTSFGARFYLTLSGLPSTDTNFPFRVDTSAGGQCMSLLLRTTGTIRLANSAGTVVATSTAALTTGTLYRVEVQCSALNGSASVLSAQVFLGDAGSPISGLSITASAVTTTTARRLRLGCMANAPTITAWQIDDFKAVTGSATAIGPAPVTLTGDVAGAVTADGTVTAVAGAAGDVDGSIAAAGSVTGQVAAAGSVTGATAASGVVTAVVGRVGAAGGPTTVGGAVTAVVGKLGAVSGVVTAAGVVSGAVGRRGNVTGAITATGMVAGVVGKLGAVTGAVTADGTVAGSIAGAGLTGSVTGPTTATGSVAGAVGRVAQVSGPTSVSGTVTGLVAKLAQVAGVTTATGTVAGVVARSGAVQGAITVGGSVSGFVSGAGGPVTTVFVTAGPGSGPAVGQGHRGPEPYAGADTGSGPFVTGVQ